MTRQRVKLHSKKGLESLDEITLHNGFTSPGFVSGIFGEGVQLRKKQGAQNQYVLELQDLIVHGDLDVNKITVKKWSHVGAGYIFSSAGFKIERVEELPDGWRIYPKSPEENDFKKLDQALCQNFKTDGSTAIDKRYWRLVTGVAADRSYIDLSKTDASGNGVPAPGNDIIQLGHRGGDNKRKGAIIISSYGDKGPYFQSLRGIDSYDLSSKTQILIGEETVFRVNKFEVQSGSGQFYRVPVERGEWRPGVSYYYYDRVSFAGSILLCVVPGPIALSPIQAPGAWELQVAKGDKGDKGIPGAKGADGKTTYFHIAYADSASGGGFSQNPTGKKYIGTYSDFIELDSNDPGKYKWTLVKGDKGDKGAKGADGNGIENIVVEYAKVKSGSSAPQSGWTKTVPVDGIDEIVYQRSKITYTNGDVRYTTPVQLQTAFDFSDNNLVINAGRVIKNDSYRIAYYKLSNEGKNLENGDIVTAVFKAEIGVGKTWIGFYNSTGSHHMHGIDPGEGEHIYKTTFKWSRVSADTNKALLIYLGPQEVARTSKIKWFKLVRGNKTTLCFTPSLQELEDASHVAKVKAEEAKQRAEDTYTRAQSDGKLTEKEVSAIVKSRAEALKQQIEYDYLQINAKYAKIKLRKNIDPSISTQLTNWHITFTGAKTDLSNKVAGFLTGSVFTEQEYSSKIQQHTTLYNQILKDFSSYLEEVKLSNNEFVRKNLVFREDINFDEISTNHEEYRGVLVNLDDLHIAPSATHIIAQQKVLIYEMQKENNKEVQRGLHVRINNAANNQTLAGSDGKNYNLGGYTIYYTIVKLPLDWAGKGYKLIVNRSGLGGNGGLLKGSCKELKVEAVLPGELCEATAFVEAESIFEAKIQNIDNQINLSAQKILGIETSISSIEVKYNNITSVVQSHDERISTVEQTQNSWSSTITKSDKIISQILQDGENVKITASHIKLEGLVTINENFKILQDGTIEAKDGVFKGRIEASSGKIGEFKIENGGLSYGGDRLRIYYNFLRYETEDISAFVGAGIPPSTGMSAAGRFVCRRQLGTYSAAHNFGVILGASGCQERYEDAGRNIAVYTAGGSFANFCLHKRTVSDSYVVEEFDGFIKTTQSANIVITLPANPGHGRLVFITNRGRGELWISGNGKQILKTSVVDGTGLGRDSTAMLVFDKFTNCWDWGWMKGT